MSNVIATGPKANIAGSLWMILAMAAFAIEDAFIKSIARDLPFGQTLMIFGLGGAAIFAAILRTGRAPLYIPDVLSKPMLARVVLEITGRLFYFLAVALIPLSVATVILQATPLVVVLGAVVFFGETVGWRRWLAIFIGLIGVLIILQPGTEAFSTLSLLAVIGMLGLAGRDLASRKAPATISTSLLGFYGFLAVASAGAVYAIWDGQSFTFPDLRVLLFLAFAILAGTTAYFSLMKAMRMGDVSAVTPFRYTRLLFGVALGVLLFGETLTAPTIIGSLLIVLSGLFTMWRGRP